MQVRIFAAAAFVLVVTTTAVRAEDKIHVCLNERTGELRMVTTPSCPAHFTQVAWTVSMPTGSAGPIGQQGPAGPVGPTGTIGPAGPIGPTGAAGPVGPTGTMGPAGPVGPTGAAGPLGPEGPRGLQGLTGSQGVAGVQGLQGAQGDRGPAGPAGTYTGDSPLTVVDQNGQTVGVAAEPYGGMLMRRVGDDSVLFFATSMGPQLGPIDFYHATSDCSDSKYLPISGGAGFTFFATVRGGTVVYTKTVDAASVAQVPILAYEHFEAADDVTHPGVCSAYDGGLASLGVVTTATDPVLANLALPLRLK